MSGIKASYSNSMTWYLSAMMIAKLLLYPILRRYKTSFSVNIAIFAAFILAGWLSMTCGCLGATMTWNGVMYIGLLRAFLGLLTGCICYEFASYISGIKFSSVGLIGLHIIKLLLLFYILFYMQFSDQGIGDYVVFIAMFFLVAIVYSGVIKLSIFNKKIPWLRKMSLAIYVIQGAWLLVISRYEFQAGFEIELLLYLLGTVLSALLLVIVVKKMNNLTCLFFANIIFEHDNHDG